MFFVPRHVVLPETNDPRLTHRVAPVKRDKNVYWLRLSGRPHPLPDHQGEIFAVRHPGNLTEPPSLFPSHEDSGG